MENNSRIIQNKITNNLKMKSFRKMFEILREQRKCQGG